MDGNSRASALEAGTLLIGRLLLATIFLHEGVAKLVNYAGAAAYTRAFGVPELLLPLAIAIELGCGLLIAFGLYTRAAAVLLAGFCVFTAAVFHTKFGERNQLLHFEKNMAIAGGLLILSLIGPGRIAIVDWFRSSK